MKFTRHVPRALTYYVILALLYLILNLVLPPNDATRATYHLSTNQYHIILAAIILPLIAIWFTAFYGYSAFREYAAVIEDTNEGEAARNLSTGLMWLAWALPIPSLLGLILTAIANAHPGFTRASVLITNYVDLLMPLIAFHIMSTGSRMWTEHQGVRISIGGTKALVFSFVTIGATYCYIIFHHIAAPGSGHNTYYLMPWLVLLTIVIPYMYAWFTGFLSAYELHLVSKRMPGVLYRQALQHMSRGLLIIVLTSIALQYLRTVIPATGNLGLGSLIIIIYCLLVIMGLGYVLLSFGTRKLKKIEEI